MDFLLNNPTELDGIYFVNSHAPLMTIFRTGQMALLLDLGNGKLQGRGGKGSHPFPKVQFKRYKGQVGRSGRYVR